MIRFVEGDKLIPGPHKRRVTGVLGKTWELRKTFIATGNNNNTHVFRRDGKKLKSQKLPSAYKLLMKEKIYKEIEEKLDDL